MIQHRNVMDIEDALKRAMGDMAFLQMMLDDFQHMAPDLIQRFEKAVEDNDLSQLAKDAHQLLGAAATLGANRIATAVSELEKNARQNQGSDIRQILEQVKARYLGFKSYIATVAWDEFHSP